MRWNDVVLALGMAAPVAAHAQARHEMVRGRVTSDSGRVVAAAQVIVRRVADSSWKSASTDSAGRYSVDWPDGRGAYVVSVTAPGFAPVQLRVARRGEDSVIVADLSIPRVGAQRLAPVVARAKRPAPDRDPATYTAGGSESSTIAQNTARRLAPDQAGDLNAIASMLPGVTPTASGISVLGLPSAQNAVTLNGMAFAGADIPRDALTRVRVQTSTYDPANGWFSGAQTAVDLVIGSQFTNRTMHWTGDAPPLQYNDPVAARLGQRIANLNGSIGGTGQLVDDRWAYNFGVQGGRKSSSNTSLLTADTDLLEHAGVAPDSVTRFLAALQQAGIPASLGGLPGSRIDDNLSFIGRIDHAPYDLATLEASPVTYGLQTYAKWGHSQAQGVNPVGTPAHGGTTTQAIGSLTGFWSALFGKDYLADVRTSVTGTENRSAPYLGLPDGRALVTSTFPNAAGGISNLQFGGNGGMHNDSRSWRWETMAQLQLYPAGKATHRVKVAADARFDAFSQDVLGNRLGTFSYSSLADLTANRPSSFTRILSAPTRTGGEWQGFASLGDLWRVSPTWQLLYGARVDANAFVHRPAYNAALDNALGVRTDGAPSAIDVSPRFGGTWQNGKGKIVRFGVGQFRNLVDPALLAAPSVSTGLPNGTLRLACIGAAVPTPDWTAYSTDPSTIPQECVGQNGILTDDAPNVQLVQSSFRPQKSWRGNFGYQSSAFRWVYTAELLGSLNLHQPGTIDRNFSSATAFTLPVEGRPVFATPAAIVPASGIVSTSLARRADAFGRVVDVVSDLRSRSAQAVLTIRPYIPTAIRPYFGDVNVSYTLTRMRAEQRGFDGATFGDPNAVEWARGDLDSRHQVVAQWVFRPLRDGRVITFMSARFRSGLPFTPMIGSDVNGDGLANDRAFVYDPATVGDPSVASGLKSLLTDRAPSARHCLASQLGRAAARNSCEGPWSASMNAGVRLGGQQLLHMPRADVTLNLTNPLGGLDLLLHGANGLHGWGTAPLPDPTLYSVRGFDATTNRFQYVVNPRFGSTSPANSTLRAPFRLTLDVNLDIARPMSEQQLDRWLRPGRAGRSGAKATAVDFTKRYQRVVPDPYGELLQETDSLLLSKAQVAQIEAVRATYRARVDAIWTDLGSYLGSLPDRYDFGAAAKRVDDTIDDVWEITRLDVQEQLGGILAPAQTASLGGWAGQLYRSRDRLHIRLSPHGM
jgi:carboxypeptidase family protein